MLSSSSKTLWTVAGALAVLTLVVAAATGAGGEAGGVGGGGEKEGTKEGVMGAGTCSTFISSGGFSKISNSRVNGNTSCFTISTVLSVAGNFSLTPLISLIRLVLEISGISFGATLQDFLHISSSITSIGDGSDVSVQDVGLGIGILSSFEEESSHLSSTAVLNMGWLLRAAEVGEAIVLRAIEETVVGDGGRGSSSMDPTAAVSDIWPPCSFFSPLRTSLRTGEGGFNTGSGFGFSSRKEKIKDLKIILESEIILYYFGPILLISYTPNHEQKTEQNIRLTLPLSKHCHIFFSNYTHYHLITNTYKVYVE